MESSSILISFLLCFLLLNLLSVSVLTANDNGCKDTIRFVNGSGFKIALFADLHYGENAWTDWGPAQDVNSDRVMSTVLDSEKPDFVIYLGDLITANNLAIQNASLYWEKAISPTRKRGIPFSTVFGNHDDAYFVWPSDWFSSSGIPQIICPNSQISDSSSTYSIMEGQKPCGFRGTTRVELMETEISKNVLSNSMNGPKELWPGVSNYILKVLSSDGSKPVLFMYFFDSGGGSYPQVISNAQTEWFTKQSQIINPNGKVPEVIFWHIPSIAYSKIAPKPNSSIKKPCIGSINKESVASQEAEFGIMDILSTRPSVQAIFVGHNHGLDWCCPYETLWLCFARHTGYGGYGGWPRGARILEITENPFSLKTWIRMENETTHSYVDLTS